MPRGKKNSTTKAAHKRPNQKAKTKKTSAIKFTWIWAKENTIYLALLLLLLINAVNISSIQTNHTIVATTTRSFHSTELPVLLDSSSFPILSAQAVYAIDVSSAVALYEKNPDELLFPASTTKMITALVALDTYELNQVLQVGSVKVVGQKMGLFPGEEISVENLLYGILVHSANDAAEVLAQNHPAGRQAFIEAMNRKAEELHAYNTTFANPSGLDSYSQFTTAKDLARIGVHAMKNDIFSEIVATESHTAISANGLARHYLTNRNDLLGRVDGVLGIKTGWTENARENLVTYVERDGKAVVIALLGSQDRFGETTELVEWIFNAYQWKKIEYNYSAGVSEGASP